MYFTQQDIQQRRSKLAIAWDNILNSGEAVLVFSGEPIQKPGGLDQMYPFLVHPSYFWLTGRRREGEVLLYNRDSGWIEFQREHTRDQMIWEGEKHDLLVSGPGRKVTDLEDFLRKQGYQSVYKLGQSGEVVPTESKAFDLRTLMDQTRRRKDEAEIRLIRHAADIATYGYQEIKRVIRPGITEKEIQIAYESEIFRRGAHTTPYDTIVGSGTNSAILHFYPSHKVVEAQELILVDAGVDVYDYCVDITRVFGSTAEMSSQQKALYQLVLSVQEACMAMSAPGVYWRDVHSKAAAMLTEGLLGMGILKGNLSSLLEKEVVSAFFPHGLGHLVGLRVRDTGHEENTEPKSYFGARLRVDIQLEEGHLITVEPGLYFIQALLDAPETRSKYIDDISWNELSQWMHIGGVRIEDNILITKSGNENLTAGVEKALTI